MSNDTKQSRQPAGSPASTGGEFKTMSRLEAAGVELSAPPSLASRTGLLVEVDDPVSIGNGAQQWRVTGVVDEQTVQLTADDGKSRKAKAATLVIGRPLAEMPNGRYSAHPKDEQIVVELIAKWQDRDPEYTAQLEDTLENLPFWGVGSYDTARIKSLVPKPLWTRVAQSPQTALYLSLRGEQNGYTHQDALTAAEGHAAMSNRRPERAELEAMSDAELRESVLVWGIRNDSEARNLTRDVQAARVV